MSAGSTRPSDGLTVAVTKRDLIASNVVALELRALDDAMLPAFTAGAHVDLHLPNGLVRQYSLCGDPEDRGCYRLGILLAAESRGGSLSAHRDLAVGSQVVIGPPRNLFELTPEGTEVVLVGGGIGITPLLAMAHSLRRAGRVFTLHACARTADRLAFRSEIAAFGDAAQVHLDDGREEKPFDFERDVGSWRPGRVLYTCGPDGFMAMVREQAGAAGWPAEAVRQESFSAAAIEPGERFTVEARRSGVTVEVGETTSIAEALAAAGVAVELSCEQGVCGTCLTPIVEGVPDHRDLYLTDDEKARNDCLTICCSRAKSARLVLDI